MGINEKIDEYVLAQGNQVGSGAELAEILKEMVEEMPGPPGPQGPQGPQGNTGSSVDYPFELVNNLTTDDPEKGLSAAQGVVLKGEVSQLGQEVDDLQDGMVSATYSEISGGINTNGTISAPGNYVHTTDIHLKKGDVICVKSAGFGFAAVSLSNNGTYTPVVKVGSGEASTVAPYYYIAENDCSVSACYKKSVPGYAVLLKWELEEVETIKDVLNITGLRVNITDEESWRDGYSSGSLDNFTSSSTLSSILVPVKGGMVCSVSGNSGFSSNYRVFDENGSEILKNGGAYFSGVSNGDFQMPFGAKTFQVVANVSVRDSVNVLYERVDSERIYTIESAIYKSRALKIPMEMGGLLLSDGSIILQQSNKVTAFASQKQKTFLALDVSNGAKINSVNLESGEQLLVFCYDSNFAFLGHTGTIDGLYDGTKYIKFCIYTQSPSAQYQNIPFTKTRTLDVSVTIIGEPIFVKNGATPLTPFFKSFEVSIPMDVQDSDSQNYYGNNGIRTWDNGFIILPPNYSREGEPVPVVVFCHGSYGYSFSETSVQLYGDYLNFVAQNGYAVVDCSGMTAYYKTSIWGEGVSTNDGKGYPLMLDCYAEMLKNYSECFNIDVKSGVFLLSKSAGGLQSAMLGYASPFKVKAISALAPSLMLSALTFRDINVDALNFILSRNGFPSPNVTSAMNNDADKQYFLNNWEKIIGIDPFFYGIIGTDIHELLTDMYSVPVADYQNTPSIVTAISNGRKLPCPPMKIWIAEDDEAIPFFTCRWYADLVQRSGGICHLRTMPSNTGGHHCVDNAENAPKTNYQTRFGGVVNVPIAYAEAVDWFRQWE